MRSLSDLHGGVEEGANLEFSMIDHPASHWAVLDGSIFSVGRFRPLYRIDYMDQAGTVARGPTRPILPKISAYLGADPFRN
jgi:hypothetical protein